MIIIITNKITKIILIQSDINNNNNNNYNKNNNNVNNNNNNNYLIIVIAILILITVNKSRKITNIFLKHFHPFCLSTRNALQNVHIKYFVSSIVLSFLTPFCPQPGLSR